MSWRYTSDPIGARMATLPDFRSRSLVGDFPPHRHRQDQPDDDGEPSAKADGADMVMGKAAQPAPPQVPSTLPFLVAMLAEHMPTVPAARAHSAPATTPVAPSRRRDRLI